MLDVSSPRWVELDHAYGAAGELPRQLYALFENEYYGSDPNDVLFGCLCHQGSIYTATYAAVPHCVKALDTQSVEGKIWLLMFLGHVAISTDAAPIPPDLEHDFRQAMLRARDLVIDLAQTTGIGEESYCHLLAAVPAIHGYTEVNRIVDWMLTADEVIGFCRECGEEFSASSGKLPFEGHNLVQHPTHAPSRTGTFTARVGIQPTLGEKTFTVSPASAPTAKWDGWIRADNALDWLFELSITAGQKEVSQKVLALFGALDCPHCDARLSLWDAALANAVSDFSWARFERE